ncbi:hypothetical protein fugu_015536 [Takifugu bimaculatus]|uniref:G-protein coupled receptors family 3 profile domain-containing protein n=1 Tax=Takifugu bimaculatus TaxID=433685 RepID=A0A4Z2C118_9TELE|nr:hypothetical protein fugu_015536 [Takifugu bimaculatus]
MAFLPVLLLLLLNVAHRAESQDSDSAELLPRGCGWGLGRPYTLLCDLDSIWGVAVESAAAAGVLTGILLALVLLCRLRHVSEAEKRSGVGPILLLILGVLGLFGLSFAYLIEQDESLCLLRRALWGLLFAVCFSCLLVQGVRLRRLGRERRSPGGCALTALALGLSAVQGIIAAEWLLLTVLREGRAACQYLPLDFSLACTYVLALLLAALTAACPGPVREDASVALQRHLVAGHVPAVAAPVGRLDRFLSVRQRLAREVSGLERPGSGHRFSGSRPTAPDYFDTSQNSTRMRETSFDEDIPLSHRQFVENQGYGYNDENTCSQVSVFASTGLRSGGGGGQPNSNTGARPSAPFRSNVYQPTEMTMILNGGAVPSAPPTYTGRQLW